MVNYKDERKIEDIKLKKRVNGEVRKKDRKRRMILYLRKIINYV